MGAPRPSPPFPAVNETRPLCIPDILGTTTPRHAQQDMCFSVQCVSAIPEAPPPLHLCRLSLCSCRTHASRSSHHTRRAQRLATSCLLCSASSCLIKLPSLPSPLSPPPHCYTPYPAALRQVCRSSHLSKQTNTNSGVLVLHTRIPATVINIQYMSRDQTLCTFHTPSRAH